MPRRQGVAWRRQFAVASISPDGTRIAYLAPEHGRRNVWVRGIEEGHLYRVDLDAPDEPAVDLTPTPPGSRLFGAEPMPSVPGSVLVWMNRRPMSIDVFRIDVATGETTLHLEQTQPQGNVLLDQDGEAAFRSLLAEDGTVEFSAVDPRTGRTRLLRRMGGAEHPVGVQPQLVTPAAVTAAIRRADTIGE